MRHLAATLGLLTFLVIPPGCSCPSFLRVEPGTPLARAAAAGNVELMRTLLHTTPLPDQLDGHGLTPMVWAARSGQVGSIHVLLAAGADPDLRDGHVNGWTPLMHAIHKSQDLAALALLEGGAGVNVSAPNGTTALMMAAGEGNLRLTRELLERGADPRAETHNGTTTLTNAVASGDPDIVKALLDRAPDLRLKDTLNDSLCLLSARLRGEEEIVTMVTHSPIRQ